MSPTHPQLADPAIGGAQTVHRTIDVLRMVAQLQRSGATATRIGRATGLSRPTVFRILSALERDRVVERRGDQRGYWLGPLAYELGLAARPKATLQSRWQAAVEQVAMRTRLTSYLIGRSGDEAVCLICVQGAAAIRAMPVEVGQRVPLGVGAGSLAILASLSDEEIRRIMGRHQKNVAVFPRGDALRDNLLERVEATRALGFAMSTGTVAGGVSGVGVLIPSVNSEERLAITVSAVTEHMTVVEGRKLASELSRAIRA